MKLQKIIFVDLTSFWGGGEVYSHTIMRQLLADGCEVISLSPHSKHTEVATTHHLIDGSFKSFWKLARLLRQLSESADIIHFNGLKSIYLSFITSKKARFICSKHLSYYSPSNRGIKYFASLLLARVLYLKFDQIISINSLIERELPSYSRSKSQVVLNGVPNVPVNIRTSHSANEALRICFVGRLQEHKGLSRLLDAILLLKEENVKLVVAGTGNLEQYLIDFIDKHNLSEKVEYLGFVQATQKVYEESHVCALPSVHEGLPLSLLEAMRSGCALVGHQTPGVEDIITNGVNGYITGLEPESIAAAISEMLKNPEKLELLRKASRGIYLEKFTSDRMVEDTRHLYEKILD